MRSKVELETELKNEWEYAVYVSYNLFDLYAGTPQKPAKHVSNNLQLSFHLIKIFAEAKWPIH